MCTGTHNVRFTFALSVLMSKIQLLLQSGLKLWSVNSVALPLSPVLWRLSSAPKQCLWKGGVSFGLLLTSLLCACCSFSADFMSSHCNAVTQDKLLCHMYYAPLLEFYNQMKARAKNIERSNEHTNSLFRGCCHPECLLNFLFVWYIAIHGLFFIIWVTQI